MLVFQNVFIMEGGQYRTDRWFTDFTAMAFTMPLQYLSKGGVTFNTDNIRQLSTGISKVFAQIVINLNTKGHQLSIHHLLNQRRTTTTAGRSFGRVFNIPHGATTALHRCRQITFGNIKTGTDLSRFR